MDNTQKVFVTIVGAVVLLILIFIVGPGRCIIDEDACIKNGEEPTLTSTPVGTVSVTIESSDTKELWLEEVMAQFNNEEHKTSNGNTIVVQANHVRSGPSKNAILDGTSQPVVWSPGDSSWVEQINAVWQQEHNKPINSQPCRPTVNAPVGFAMWRPMAEALGWPNEPIGWDTIVELAADPQGWASYDHPEWGQFSFGHTHPAYSNTGLLSMTSFVYGALDTQEPLMASQVYEAEEAMRVLEQVTSNYGRSSTAVLELMAREGPGYLNAAAVPEANVARFNIEHADELHFPLAFIIPAGGTIWANHPYCILDNAEWVEQEEAKAAAIFRDYLLSQEKQELAIDKYIRPADTTIALHSPLDLNNGVDPSVSPDSVPNLPSPDSDVSAAVQDLFGITKRKATVILVLDTSGSMAGEPILSSTTATAEFVSRLDPDDEVALITFADDVIMLYEPTRAGDIVEQMTETVYGLIANGGTALNDSVCQATNLATELKGEDKENDESRLYGIVLLSDGDDTTSQSTENQMFVNCLPNSAEVDGIKIFPIAFGEEANKKTLERISNVTGGKVCEADQASISDCYLEISAYQ